MLARTTLLRTGYTLLEVMIASAITFGLVAALMSSWAASNNFSYLVNAQLKRSQNIDAIRSTLKADFLQTAQFVQYDTTLMIASIDTTTNENITLYPSVLQGGRELRFVRLRTDLTATSSPTSASRNWENFIGTNTQPLSQFALAPVSPAFVINPDAGLPSYWNISPVWDSDRAGLTFAQNATPTNLRIYRYVLIPYANSAPATLADSTTWATTAYPAYPQAGPTLRRGMLIRQYRNSGSTTWNTLGLPLSDAVVFDVNNSETNATLPSFIFATAYDGVTRTGDELVRDNEIRLRLTLAMDVSQNGTPTQLDLRYSFPFQRVDFGD
jgi:hypothetical protein